MKQLIAPRDMQACEKHYFETSGVPSIDVMERAAQALANAVLTRFPDAKRIGIACGPGGNGGDGYACARLLKEAGRMCVIFASAPARSPDTAENARRAAEKGVAIMDTERMKDMPRPDLWIDCLYGTGLSRTPQGISAEIIRRINSDRRRGCGVIAADIPSGLNGCSGTAYDPCVQADVTVTFQYEKYGLRLQDGLDMCGEIIAADVGFPADIFPTDMPRMIENADLRSWIMPRRRNIHKGTCGHLLIVAGSVGMAGAAALCAKAALRSGAGLVSIACPSEITPILQTLAPCAMCIPMPQDGDVIFDEAIPILKGYMRGKSAVAIGPGLTRWASSGIVRAVLESDLPAVIDADALNIISLNPDMKALLKPRHIITPHPGEAARLLGRKIEDPVADARELATLGPAVVLKGASRVICDAKETCISTCGCSGMARGGSGDILTGIMGALLAESSGRSALQTAACACEIHGLAGEKAAKKYGNRAMNSADIIEFLPEVFMEYAE